MHTLPPFQSACPPLIFYLYFMYLSLSDVLATCGHRSPLPSHDSPGLCTKSKGRHPTTFCFQLLKPTSSSLASNLPPSSMPSSTHCAGMASLQAHIEPMLSSEL